jgi:hypothetical protein
MKPIKFVILGAGVLCVLSFFLPYVEIRGDSYTPMAILDKVDVAEAGVRNVEKRLSEEAEDRKIRGDLSGIKDAMDIVRGMLIFAYLPGAVLLVIGIIGAVRGRLERVGGVIAMIIGLLAVGINGLLLAVWSTAEVKATGSSPAIAQYLLFFGCTIGFVGGLLTVIKPDRGGRFG